MSEQNQKACHVHKQKTHSEMKDLSHEDCCLEIHVYDERHGHAHHPNLTLLASLYRTVRSMETALNLYDLLAEIAIDGPGQHTVRDRQSTDWRMPSDQFGHADQSTGLETRGGAHLASTPVQTVNELFATDLKQTALVLAIVRFRTPLAHLEFAFRQRRSVVDAASCRD